MISGPGFPGTNEFLQFMDDARRKPIEGIVDAFGLTNIILEGIVTITHSSRPTEHKMTDGHVIFSGELLPFKGTGYIEGPFPTELVVIEDITESGYDTAGNKAFNDIKPVWKKRWCTLGTMALPGAVRSVPLDNFKRLPTIEQLSDRKLEVVRKGTLTVSSLNQTVTGDFTNAGNIGGNRIRINFPIIDSDYLSIITLMETTNGKMPTIHAKESDALTFTIEGGANYPYKLEIYLLKL